MNRKKSTRVVSKARRKRASKKRVSKELTELVQRFHLVMSMSPLHAKASHFKKYLDTEMKRGAPDFSLEKQRMALEEWYGLDDEKRLLLTLPENFERRDSFRYMTIDDIEILFRSLGISVCATFLRLTYAAGLQLQEALNLRRRDVDIENCKLYIAESKYRLAHESIFSPALQPELSLLSDTCEPDDYFFSVRSSKPHERRKALARRTPQIFLEKACGRLNMQNVSVRTLRDNFAIHLLQINIPKEKVAELMGFRNVHSIDRYQNFVKREKLNVLYPIEPKMKSKYWLLDNYRKRYGNGSA